MDKMKWLAATGLLALTLGANGCAQSAPRQVPAVKQSHDAASAPHTVDSGEVPQQPGASADFSGSWGVQWCDNTAPEADCGRFDIDLTQAGDKISGDSFGARVRLAQIDEGGIIHGIAVGNTAILTIESLRSGGIYLIKAAVDGDCMRWEMRDTIRKAETDIDIIALDDVLTKSLAGRSGDDNAAAPQSDCRGIPTKPQN
ncbi:hypothetical protein [Luteimonas sp. A649]